MKKENIMAHATALSSGLCSLFGATTLYGLANSSDVAGITLSTFEASPVISAALLTATALNTVNQHSALSKIFTTAAILCGGAGLTYFTLQSASSGMGAQTAGLYTTIGMTTAGMFNLFSHATRNLQFFKHQSPSISGQPEIEHTAPIIKDP